MILQSLSFCRLLRWATVLLLSLIVSTAAAFSFTPHHHVRKGPHQLVKGTIPLQQNPISFTLASTKDAKPPPSDGALRDKLRKITGFSLTAVRAALRATTGISLTALYASFLLATGAWIRQSMKVVLSIFPVWFRYFLQPFLVLYYAPLFMLRNLTGDTRKRAKASHEAIVEGWKKAIKVADKKGSNWPVYVSDEGNIETNDADIDIAEAVAESVELVMEANSKK